MQPTAAMYGRCLSPSSSSSSPSPSPSPASASAGTGLAASTTSSSSSSLVDPSEPPDVFCKLGSLIVEGRLPRDDGGRGFCEGPHVPQPSIGLFGTVGGGLGGIGGGRHVCSQDSYLCKKDENFRRHMLLLWQNNVPVSIEVLLSPDCRLGRQKARSVEFSTIPEPGSILLEQWTVSVHNFRSSESVITSRGLFQAVRSYLHFSQLSAWLASSNGKRPTNVLFRITIPGETFASKFTCAPDNHFFPPAGVNRSSSVHVSVRSLPRSDEIPRVVCGHAAQSSPTTTTAEDEEGKLAVAGGLAWKEMNHDHSDLRKAIVRSKLASSASECLQQQQQQSQVGGDCGDVGHHGALPRSDSMDSMLGDSLLDPPQSLQKMPPKRYQSPRRCGSPSLEAPDHLLFGPGRRTNAYDPYLSFNNSPAIATSSELGSAVSSAERCARQDLARRRDLNLYHGLHPRLLHSDRLSLPLKPPSLQPQQMQQRQSPLAPCRAFALEVEDGATPLDDRMKLCCTISGKHICSLDDEEDMSTLDQKPDFKAVATPGSEDERWTHEYFLVKDGGKAKSPPFQESGIESDFGPLDESTSEMWKSSWQKSPFSSRRCSVEGDDDQAPVTGCQQKAKQKRGSLHDIFDDGSDRSTNIRNQLPVTQVFHAQTSEIDQGDLLLNSIIRTSERNRRLLEEEEELRAKEAAISEGRTSLLALQPREAKYLTAEINNGTGAELKLAAAATDSKRLGSTATSAASAASARMRSFSENAFNKQPDPGYHLDPLDISFDREGSSSWSDAFPSPTDEACSEDEDDDDEEESMDSGNADKENKGVVPSSEDKDIFRKSFNSAASMVFHRRTGLPLTSSPAPLRKGKEEKFDFDASITSPNDIKRALYRAESQKLCKVTPRRSRQSTTSSSEVSGRRRRHNLSASAPATVTSSNLLGSFEESVLNGRLEPVSTVEGFTAEIGASGSFQPKHKSVPVTVFFYTLGDNSTISSPYLGHINLGKKGYRVPEKGTIQVTLFNPLGTVVKMFVVVYNLSDMPPNSQTFLRQRTLYMPSERSNLTTGTDENDGGVCGNSQKWLRYLIHMRFASSKSGKIYLHTDIRMIIFRKSDLDTATDHSPGKGFELRSFTRGPNNPKFSPRK